MFVSYGSAEQPPSTGNQTFTFQGKQNQINQVNFETTGENSDLLASKAKRGKLSQGKSSKIRICQQRTQCVTQIENQMPNIVTSLQEPHDIKALTNELEQMHIKNQVHSLRYSRHQIKQYKKRQQSSHSQYGAAAQPAKPLKQQILATANERYVDLKNLNLKKKIMTEINEHQKHLNDRDLAKLSKDMSKRKNIIKLHTNMNSADHRELEHEDNQHSTLQQHQHYSLIPNNQHGLKVPGDGVYGIKLVSAEIADTTGGSSLEINKEGHIFNFHHCPVHLKDTLKKSYDHEHTLIMKSEVSSTLAKLQQDQKQSEMPIEIKTYQCSNPLT